MNCKQQIVFDLYFFDLLKSQIIHSESNEHEVLVNEGVIPRTPVPQVSFFCLLSSAASWLVFCHYYTDIYYKNREENLPQQGYRRGDKTNVILKQEVNGSPRDNQTPQIQYENYKHCCCFFLLDQLMAVLPTRSLKLTRFQ